MKQYLIIPAIALVFAACKEHNPAGTHATVTDTGKTVPVPAQDSFAAGDSAMSEDVDSSVAEATNTYYVVMADTGNSYYLLHDNMMQLSKSTGMEIDTMGRGYDAKKNLICLPENDEDEIYADEYYPRRFPSVNLSLEYLYMYMPGKQAGGHTMALVAGIFEAKQSADSLLHVIQPHSKTAFVSRAEIYTGCMH